MKDIAQYYQPLAELTAAMADLITAVHRTSEHHIIKLFPSPADLWFYWICKLSQKWLEQSGLIGKPVVVGKRYIHTRLMQLCCELENYKSKSEDLVVSKDETLSALIIGEAITLASNKEDFKVDSLDPFLRVLRRTAKKIKHCKELQRTVLLPDGNLSVTKKSVKTPRKYPKGKEM